MSHQHNVLILCADMVGAKHLGCYGNPVAVTPALDKLASSGIRFEQAYCAAPPCIPARTSIMTGKYAHTHGKVSHIKMAIDPRIPLMPQTFAEQGYQTVLIGKTHWHPPHSTLGAHDTYLTIDTHLTPELGKHDAYIQFLEEEGLFQYNAASWKDDQVNLQPDNLPESCLKVHWTGRKTCEILEKLSQQPDPFFLFASFVEPHGKGSVKSELLEEFYQKNLPEPIMNTSQTKNKPHIQHRASEKWMRQVTKEDVRRYQAGVYASLSLVDQNIGRILQTLDDLGLSDSTTLVFLSDHGDLMFDHGLIEKTFLYEAAVKIPFIIKIPSIKKTSINKTSIKEPSVNKTSVNKTSLPTAQVNHQLVSQIDLFPTLAAIGNINTENLRLDGQSLLPLLTNPDTTGREYLFCEVDQKCHLDTLVNACSAKMVRYQNWKYIYTLVNGCHIEEELYDLTSDPDECINKAHDPLCQSLCIQFQQELLRWYVSTEPNRNFPAPENHYPIAKVGPTIPE